MRRQGQPGRRTPSWSPANQLPKRWPPGRGTRYAASSEIRQSLSHISSWRPLEVWHRFLATDDALRPMTVYQRLGAGFGPISQIGAGQRPTHAAGVSGSVTQTPRGGGWRRLLDGRMFLTGVSHDQDPRSKSYNYIYVVCQIVNRSWLIGLIELSRPPAVRERSHSRVSDER